PACCSALSSAGWARWQGTHHSAQKPTTTGTDEARTARSHLAAEKGPTRAAGSSAEVRLDQLDEVVARDQADALLGDFSALDDEQGGQRRDVVLEGHVLVLLDVDLAYPQGGPELLRHHLHRGH